MRPRIKASVASLMGIVSFPIFLCIRTATIVTNGSLLVEEAPHYGTPLPRSETLSFPLLAKDKLKPLSGPTHQSNTRVTDSVGNESVQHARTGSFANCTHETLEPKSRGSVDDNSFYDGKIIVACHGIHYKAPLDMMAQHQDSEFPIVYGVLSGPGEEVMRNSIRETWASNLASGSIFFFVGGPWEDIAIEYERKRDVVWMDMVENYYRLTYKTGAIIKVLHTHMPSSFKYLFKTDTDTFLNTHELNLDLFHSRSRQGTDYYGYRTGNFRKKFLAIPKGAPPELMGEYPEEFVPHYYAGMGFALSRRFVDCAQRHLSHIRFYWAEDLVTGLLAERCGFRCKNTPQRWRWMPKRRVSFNMTGSILAHKVKDPETMRLMWKSLNHTGY